MKSFLDQIREPKNVGKPIIIGSDPVKFTRQQIMAAKEFYFEDWVKWNPPSRRAIAMKSLKTFDWLADRLEGKSLQEIADRYGTLDYIVKSGTNIARGRVSTYLKIKENESDA